MKRHRFGLANWIARPSTFTPLALIACLLSILISCAQQPETPIRVGANVWPGFEPLFLARELGYYQGQPIELHDYPSSTEISQALRNGDLDVAAFTMDEVLSLAETNPDIQVVLVTDFSNGGDVFLAKPEIQTPNDLKGKKVGVESSALGGYMLARSLDKLGLSLDTLKISSLGVSEHEQAYKQNVVDAVITFEPVRSNLIKTGAKVLFDSSQIPGEIIDVLVTRKDVLANRERTMKALIEGWFRALDYQQQQPQDAARKMAQREQITPEQFIESLKLLTIPDRQTNIKLLNKTEPSLIENTKRLGQVMLKNKLLKKVAPIDQLISDQLVKES
ncbi:MAG: ABC transporter substrate-binding protein [Myxacorys californica WJT36-NPBG1]|jgi:NitT/TauT family transport system substrate-binding protein|nr:ABC transporter substrate-binding protein [Myxacorys californica WJT36-NPBG1]